MKGSNEQSLRGKEINCFKILSCLLQAWQVILQVVEIMLVKAFTPGILYSTVYCINEEKERKRCCVSTEVYKPIFFFFFKPKSLAVSNEDSCIFMLGLMGLV